MSAVTKFEFDGVQEILDSGQAAKNESASTFNATLDNDQRYCTVDLLRHVNDDHVLKRLALHISELTHLPKNTVFLIGLAVYSSLAARRYCVTYLNGKALPIGIYAVAEQPSGTGKSWCVNTFIEPFEKIHRDLLAKVQKSIASLEKRNNLSEFEQTELEELRTKIKRLNCGLYVSNATPEGLESTLHRTDGFFAAISSEQGLFSSLLGASYKADGAANNNDLLLNGFDGGYVNSIRISRQGYHGHVVGAVACFAQQGSIETVLKASNGTGLSERFLMLAEPHMLGKRDHTKWPEAQPELEEEYSKSCGFFESVLDDSRQFDALSRLEISKAGWRAIGEYRNKIEPHLADGGKYSHVSLRGSASKINMQIMKIAAVLHLLAGDQYQAKIDDSHVLAAIGIADQLLEANLKLCQDKGILGIKAEYTSILALFENDRKPRTERMIITTKVKSAPFKDFTGNKSDQVRSALAEMVSQRLLEKEIVDEKPVYRVAQ